jgi:hypothetical protein
MLVLALNMIKADQSYNCLILIMIVALAGHDTACLQADCRHSKVAGSVYPERDCDFRAPFGNNCRDISVMAQSPTVTIVVIGTVTRIILGISIQSLIGSAMAGMVFAATTQDHFGLATASQYLGIGARFTM